MISTTWPFLLFMLSVFVGYKGLLWAILILASILFFTGNVSHFVYVDF